MTAVTEFQNSIKMATASPSSRIKSLEPNDHFLPTPPPRAPRSVTLNALEYLKAPYIALAGGHSPEEAKKTSFHSHKISFGSRHRIIRNQVGVTNRWQLPNNLELDLLGTSQAKKAIRVGFNKTLRRFMTGESPISQQRRGAIDGLSQLPGLTSANVQAHDAESQVSTHLQCLYKRSHHEQKAIRPEQAFCYHAQKMGEGLQPDVVLLCLGVSWDLHRPYLIKSTTLSKLLMLEDEQDMQEREGKEKEVKEQEVKQEEGNEEEVNEEEDAKDDQVCRQDHISSATLKHKEVESRPKKMKWEKVTLILEVEDELVTKTAFAFALRNLYFSEIVVDPEIAVELLASAFVLQFQDMFQECVLKMKKFVSSANIGNFYYAACKYKQDGLIQTCEEWLEVNLVPSLGKEIYLRQLPQALLQKVLKSSRLFTYNEYRLLKIVIYWLFLQNNPKIQILPAHNTILSYFSSLSKKNAFLEREMGQCYLPIFQSLRLHGITECRQLEELRQANVLPKEWLVRVLSNHHYALQNGGDMPLQTDSFTQAVRFGMIVKQDPQYYSEIIDLYGFFFELKAVRHDNSTYSFYMQRMKPANPGLAFQISERSPFSLRQEREVKYKITTLSQVEGKWKEFSTGMITQKFGIASRNRKSKVLKVWQPSQPIYVTFAFLFPPS